MSAPFLSITSSGGNIGRIRWSNTVIQPHHQLRTVFRYDPPAQTRWGKVSWDRHWPIRLLQAWGVRMTMREVLKSDEKLHSLLADPIALMDPLGEPPFIARWRQP
jgi:hypothetical protein